MESGYWGNENLSERIAEQFAFPDGESRSFEARDGYLAEHRLLVGIIVNAIGDAAGISAKSRKVTDTVKTEARVWLFTEGTEFEPAREFSLVWCCHILSLEVEAVRDRARDFIRQAEEKKETRLAIHN